MQDQSDTGVRAVFLVDMDRFDLMTRVLGCESDTARAALIDVNTRTVARARESGIVSGTFVANALVAFQRREAELTALNLHPTFDSLFRVAVIPRSGGTDE